MLKDKNKKNKNSLKNNKKNLESSLVNPITMASGSRYPNRNERKRKGMKTNFQYIKC
jgi:hypothetical protein